jgi:hypothetical protein
MSAAEKMSAALERKKNTLVYLFKTNRRLVKTNRGLFKTNCKLGLNKFYRKVPQCGNQIEWFWGIDPAKGKGAGPGNPNRRLFSAIQACRPGS